MHAPGFRALMLVAALLLTAMLATAQTPPEPPRPRPGRDEPRPPADDAARAERGAVIREFLAQLKERDPESYERLAALRETDRAAWEKQLRELMQKYEFRPRRPGSQGGPQRHVVVERVLEELKARNPEAFERLKTLQQNDPEAFRQELQKLFAERGRDFYEPMPGVDLAASEQAIKALQEAWRQAETEDEKARLRAELATLLGETFDGMTESQVRRLEQIERELAAMRQMIEKRRELRDQIIERHLQKLLGEKGPAWRGPPPGPEEGHEPGPPHD